eukprot:5577006-Pyramimonas_sp.AAC.1
MSARHLRGGPSLSRSAKATRTSCMLEMSGQPRPNMSGLARGASSRSLDHPIVRDKRSRRAAERLQETEGVAPRHEYI